MPTSDRRPRPRRRPDRADESGDEWQEILTAMHAAIAASDADVEPLRRRFMAFAVEHRRQTPEAAAEMWSALRRRPQLLPQLPPSDE
jgi:hypothetical protein